MIPAPLTIAAESKVKRYGSENPSLTVSYNGFVLGEDAGALSTPVVVTTTATISSAVGTYPITASGAASPNYAVTFVDGTLAVTPVTLTITANDQSRVVDTLNPAFTASYLGFVLGETPAVLLTPVNLATTALPSSPLGSYPIIASGATALNYVIVFVNGTLTVVAPLSPAPPPAPILIPVTSGESTTLSGQATTTLQLPDGNEATFTPGSGDAASIAQVTQSTLPATLPAGSTLVGGMTVNLTSGGTAVSTLATGNTLTLSFAISPAFMDRPLSLLRWNPALNGGLGGWETVAVPITVTTDGYAVAVVDLTGTFALTAH